MRLCLGCGHTLMVLLDNKYFLPPAYFILSGCFLPLFLTSAGNKSRRGQTTIKISKQQRKEFCRSKKTTMQKEKVMFQNDKTAIYEFIFIDHIVFIFMGRMARAKSRQEGIEKVGSFANGDSLNAFHAVLLR